MPLIRAGRIHFSKLELLTWITPLAAIFLVAAFLRLVQIDRDRPIVTNSDEPYYFLWAQSIRETGRPDFLDGSGYPPGFLYMLIGEQLVVESLNGGVPDSTYDYFVLARVVNGILGAATVILIAFLARVIGKSKLPGLAAAVYLAIWPLFVMETRKASANSPWLFFTLMSLLFIVYAPRMRSLLLLDLAFVTGIISLLFKYQSGVILALPFIFGILFFRHKRAKLIRHVGAWGLIALALLMWLIFEYGSLSIVNTPSSHSASVVENGRLLGFQSLSQNWDLLTNATGSRWIPWAAIWTVVLATVGIRWQQAAEAIEARSVFGVTIFVLSFYLIMSFFVRTHDAKWLPTIAVTIALAGAGLVATARIVVGLLFRFVDAKWRKHAMNIVPAALLLLIGVPFSVDQWRNWNWTYQNYWSLRPNLVLLNEWFDANVPQGGRVVAEANKMINNYPGAPAIFHHAVVGSIFDEPMSAYRERGYEYVIWNSMKSTPTDSLADLDAPVHESELASVEEVLRLTGDDGVGMDIVVFALDPVPQNDLYAWFDYFSFRGFDLLQERTSEGLAVTVTLYWMSVAVTESDLVVFVHLVDPETNTLVAQHDGPPGNGFDNTWKWLGDMQFHIDPHTLLLGDAPADGNYELRIGMYAFLTLERVDIEAVSPDAIIVDRMLVIPNVRISE